MKLLWLLIGWFSLPIWQEQRKCPEWRRAGRPSKVEPGQWYMLSRNPQNQWTPSAWDESPSHPAGDWEEYSSGGDLEEVGRLLELLSTWLLAQMAVEDGPSTSGGEEPAQRKLRPTIGGKALQKEFLKASKVEKPQRYWPGMMALHAICWFQKSADVLICKLIFFTSSLWYHPWSRVLWYALPDACHFDCAGSCRGIFGLAPGRYLPMHHSCKMHQHYA